MRVPEKHHDEERDQKQPEAEEDRRDSREDQHLLAPLALLAQLHHQQLRAGADEREEGRAQGAQRIERARLRRLVLRIHWRSLSGGSS
jgi:hypothetical protein